jgi:hypothetical protein
MQDMTQVITPKSDQINADDLIGGPMTITIREVQIKGGQEQPVSVYFEGSEKAFRPCKSMSRVMVAAWGPDAKQYTGRSMTLYRDPDVKWGGMAVGGIRISHMTHLDNALTLALTATKSARKPYTVRPLQIEQSAADHTAAREALAAAAMHGTDALKAAWGKIGRTAQAALQGDLPALKEQAAANNRPVDVAADDDGNPFGE